VQSNRQAGHWLPSWHYPTVVVIAFSTFAVLGAAGFPLVVRTYVPVILTALGIAAMERRTPHRREWRPESDEMTTDLTFLGRPARAAAPLIGFLFTYALIAPARALHLPTMALWPHAWPYWLQALAMILAVDFLRYWLHRAAHEKDALWRLHAVHHSVDRLYWLNTVRFHPIEKTLQMCLDSLPFLILGVHEVVLAIYSVAYATNGFFQHCNVRIRYGVLNYLVGSAETHRWHHSREPREANANYGITLIVWDLLFGTWFLPRDREVGQVGLHDNSFPKTFTGLLRAPFRR